MRAFLSSSIGVACAAALLLPLSLPSVAAAAPQDPAVAPRVPAAGTPVAGSTESLPLVPLGADRSHGVATEQGLRERSVQPFSLVGVVWDDADAELHGKVHVRTRSVATMSWSDWQELETHNAEHGADRGSKERASAKVRGSTAPLWVGASNGVQVRVEAGEAPEGAPPGQALLPRGLSLELVDPGEAPEEVHVTEGDVAPAADPAVDPASGTANAVTTVSDSSGGLGATAAKPYIGPRPKIISRKGWGADEKLREKKFGYTKTVKAAFVHHSATGNNYTCKQAPSVIRSIYRYHVTSSGWRDFGYNFVIDKCGNIYEGRAGGVTKPVMGAHTLGFNTNSTGIAALGTYSSTNPPAAVTTAVAKLTAWKLGLHGINPRGKVTLTSAGSNKYKNGAKVQMNAIAGHRDGFVTDCPGARLYSKLGAARVSAAKYQGR